VADGGRPTGVEGDGIGAVEVKGDGKLGLLRTRSEGGVVAWIVMIVGSGSSGRQSEGLVGCADMAIGARRPTSAAAHQGLLFGWRNQVVGQIFGHVEPV